MLRASRRAELGETQPKVPNATADSSDHPARRQHNRRVEITIKKPG